MFVMQRKTTLTLDLFCVFLLLMFTHSHRDVRDNKDTTTWEVDWVYYQYLYEIMEEVMKYL
jgi:hypothetical protein